MSGRRGCASIASPLRPSPPTGHCKFGPMTSSGTGFTGWDWVALGGYFVLLVVTGLAFSRKPATARDYFLAGRSIPTFAAAVSFIATALSAATFIGAPQQSYKSDLSYLSANLGAIIAVAVAARFFIPTFFTAQVVTVYGFLEERLGTGARLASAAAFLVGRIFADGARLYIAAIPTSLIVFGDLNRAHLLLSVAVMTLTGVFYTYLGGIRAVIFTDVIQAMLFTCAAVGTVVVLLDRIPLDLTSLVNVLQHSGDGGTSKLKLLKIGWGGFGPEHTYTLLSVVVGFTLLNLGAYGTDQNMVQRALTCKSAVKGAWSTVAAVVGGIPLTALFMLIGLLLYVFYACPDVMGSAAPGYAPESSRQIFLTFIIREMPPGVRGLMMAGLFAAALSTVNSALNSLSSVLISDFYSRIRSGLPASRYLRAGRLGVLGFGLALGAFAAASVFWQEARPHTTLIDFALQVMTFAYSGLVAVFMTAIFTRRGSSASTVAALVAGFGAVSIMQWKMSAVLAFPWQMAAATALSFGICCLGRRKNVIA